MATKSVTTKIKNPQKTQTTSVEFDYLPVFDKHLFAVKEGIDVQSALSASNVLSTAVQELIGETIAGDLEISGNLAYLCEFAMKAAKGLREAAGV